VLALLFERWCAQAHGLKTVIDLVFGVAFFSKEGVRSPCFMAFECVRGMFVPECSSVLSCIASLVVIVY